MKILIISSTCSKKKYQNICDRRRIKSLDTNQKFFSSIINGFKLNNCQDITCISVLPVSYRTYPDRYLRQEKEVVDNVLYHYCKTINLPLIRTVYASFQVKHLVKEYLNKNINEKILIITDGLFYEFSKACKYIHKKKRHVYTVVTDIPEYVSNTCHSKSFKSYLLDKYGEITTFNLRKDYDGYVLLTEQMNEICNVSNKPYIVIEGLLSEHERNPKILSKDESLPTVLYAGKYNREFGTLMLANAAKYLKNICNIVMYGAGGDCVDELLNLSESNENLSVNSIIPLERLLKIESEVDLLVNPRPDGQSFTKYSFPSKTLEYLDSGTPVLMYKLEGVPQEYDEYLFYINGKTPIEIADSIINVLSLGKKELYRRGMLGKCFVRRYKSCAIQTKKILDFFDNYEK